MSRRLTTFVLAAFYLLQATWLLHAGMDLLLPAVRTAVASSADSCCKSKCGCPEEVKRTKGCCCMPGKLDPTPAKKPGSASFIEELRCKGVEAAMTQAFTQPVVCGFATIWTPVLETSLTNLPTLQPVLPHPADSLEKVPIDRA